MLTALVRTWPFFPSFNSNLDKELVIPFLQALLAVLHKNTMSISVDYRYSSLKVLINCLH